MAPIYFILLDFLRRIQPVWAVGGSGFFLAPQSLDSLTRARALYRSRVVVLILRAKESPLPTTAALGEPHLGANQTRRDNHEVVRGALFGLQQQKAPTPISPARQNSQLASGCTCVAGSDVML